MGRQNAYGPGEFAYLSDPVVKVTIIEEIPSDPSWTGPRAYKVWLTDGGNGRWDYHVVTEDKLSDAPQ